MPKYLIERRIPNAGAFTPAELHAISVKSNGVLHGMQRDGTPIHWVQSYVTDDAIHCVYVAPDAEAVRRHAECGGFPADKVSEVRGVIDPVTGE
ncbi:MAG: DUF4242 domain-containing protein [Chloroflexota bacterium]